MGFAGVAHRFPTTVVGSLPRPAWLLDRWEEQGDPQVIARRRLDYLPPWYAEARPAEQPKPLGEAEQARLLDQAVPFAIAMQIPCRSEERQRRGTSAVPKSTALVETATVEVPRSARNDECWAPRMVPDPGRL